MPDHEPSRYVSGDSPRTTVDIHEAASEHRPATGAAQVGDYVEANARRNLEASVDGLLRRWRRRHSRAIRGVAKMRHAAVSDRSALARAREAEAFYTELLTTITPSLAPPINRATKLSVKVIIVLAECFTIGAVIRDVLEVARYEAWLSAVGMSIALLLVPTVASFARKVLDAGKYRKELSVYRILLLHSKGYAFSKRPAAVVGGLFLAYLAFIIPVAWLYASVFRTGKGPTGAMLLFAIIIGTGIGVFVLEFRVSGIAVDLIAALERYRRKFRREIRALDRRRRTPLARLAGRQSSLVLFEAMLVTEAQGRRAGAVAEALVAGGDADLPSESDLLGEEAVSCRPTQWTTDMVDHEDELRIDLLLAKRAADRFSEQLDFLLELCDGPEAPRTGLAGGR